MKQIIPNWIRSIVGSIIAVIGVIGFTTGVYMMAAVLIFTDKTPCIEAILFFGLYLFVCFYIFAIGININPAGRAWVKSGQKEKVKGETKMMW